MTTTSVDQQPAQTVRQRHAKQSLVLFFALMIPLSAALQWYIISTGQHDLVWLLMWVPGLASLLVRAMLREGVRDVSFCLGGRHGLRILALAYVLPLATVLAVFGTGWLSGLAPFDPPPSVVFPWANGNRPALLLLAVARAVPLVLITNELLGAVGEEIGWRGFLLTRLIESDAPQPLLLSGCIWGLWHTPLIAAGYVTGGNALIGIPLFLGCAIALSYILGAFRLCSGSVWPPALAHATVNAALLVLGDKMTPGFATNPWLGETGALMTLGFTILAVLLFRSIRDKMTLPE